jgi:hypothetical protein
MDTLTYYHLASATDGVLLEEVAKTGILIARMRSRKWIKNVTHDAV